MPNKGTRKADMEDRQSTVLIADDNEAIRDLMREWLRQQGYRVLTAEDGEEAVRIVQAQPIDLAIFDVMMPRRSGFSACRAVKAKPETRLIPVVLVTGLESREDRVQGIECGADDFLNKPLDREELLARVRSLLKLKQFTDELEHAELVICSLALSIEAKDPYTNGHCGRLAKWAELLGRRLGLPEEQCVALRRAGVVHDIGKVAIPEPILLKRGPLTEEEKAIMQLHPVLGERICAPLKSLRLVLPIIRHHHEKLDGSGYPDGLRGEQIPVAACLLQIVDVFDALTSNRPYHAALSYEEAFAVMKKEAERGAWDAGLIAEFQALLGAGDQPEPARAPVLDLLNPQAAAMAGGLNGAVPRLRDLEREAVIRALVSSHGDKQLAARRLGIGRSTLYRKLKEYEGSAEGMSLPVVKEVVCPQLHG
jgi:putative two-component system response regulator